MDKGKKIIDLIGAGLIAIALSVALSMMLAEALLLPASFWQVAGACTAAAVILMAGSWSRLGKLMACVLTAALLAVLSLPAFGLLQQAKEMYAALTQLGQGGELTIGQYGPLIASIIGAALTCLIYWMARMSGGVYPALTLSVIIVMGCWFFSSQLQPLYSLMALSALAVMFARASDEKISYLRAVPAAVLACALALAMLPPGGVTWPPLEQAAQKVRELFDDYFLFTDPRTTYSISADGFQSRGEFLGGPAEPSMRQVMTVETDRPLLLRGSVKRTYTTYSWTENAVNSRYVFIDPLRRSVRDQVFDTDRMENLDISQAFSPMDIPVTFLSDALSTLFVPHRITDFSAPLDMVTYFSSSGEVFITRDVQPGDSYQVSAHIPTGSVQATRRLLSQAALGGDDQYSHIQAAYTALPQGIDQQVYQLAQRLTGNHAHPYDKALAIQDHLMNNYRYTLEVDYPPQGEDFVSHFLLDSQEGYCSYFASAMAVMARMAGLPSRYVEGYLVPQREGGVTLVTGKNAHAWVEIYFEGAGWLAFNPTPGSGDSYQPPQGDDEDQSSSQNDQEDQEDPSSQEEKPGAPTPSPSPSPNPQEPLEEEDEGQPEDEGPQEPEDDPSQQDPPEESPEPEDDEDDPQEQDPPEEPESPEDQSSHEQFQEEYLSHPDTPSFVLLWILLLLTAIALAVLAFIRRLKASDPLFMTRRTSMDVEDKLAIWYRALLMALEHQGQAPAPGETSVQFARRLTQAGLIHRGFEEVARQLFLSQYARYEIDSAVLGLAQQVYEALTGQFKPLEKVRWLWRRLIHGPGSSAQIP